MWPTKVTYQIMFILIVIYAKDAFTLSDKRLCADLMCKETISLGKAKVSYTADEKGKVSFKINSQIKIKSKSAGSDPKLWGIEVTGRRGYAPKEFILEEKILIKDKDVKYEVPVESFEERDNKPEEKTFLKLKPSEGYEADKVKPTEAPVTEPLNRNAETTTPSTLNASESETETTTTAPIADENIKIVNETLREAITSVLKNFEIIDGTAIPKNEAETLRGVPEENISTENNEKSTNKVVNPNEKPSDKENEAAVNVVKKEEPPTTNEKADKESAERMEEDVKPEISSTPQEKKADNDKDQEKMKKSPPVGVSQEEINANSIDLAKEATVSQSDKDVEKDKNDAVVAGIESASNDTITSDSSTVKSGEATTPATPVEPVVSKADSDSSATSTKDNPIVMTGETTTPAKPVESAVNHADSDVYAAFTKDNSTEKAGETLTAAMPVDSGSILNDTATNDATITKTSDSPNSENTLASPDKGSSKVMETSEKPPSISEESGQLKDIAEQEIIQTGTGSLPDSDEADDEDDDDDEDEDDDGEDAEKDKMGQGNIAAASTQSFTAIPPQDFTESGYAENQNPKYWKEEEEIVTQNLQSVVDTTTAAKIAVNSENVETTTPARSVESTPTHTYEMETNAQKDNEETTTIKPPQVPPLPTALPIFQKPTTLSPSLVNEQHQNEDRVALDNGSELKYEETEAKTEETPPKQPNFDSDSSTKKYVPEKEKSTTNVEETTQENKPPEHTPREEKREDGLFSTILGTVNTLVNKLRKEEPSNPENEEDEELHKILFPNSVGNKKDNQEAEEYCEKLGPNQCPQGKSSSQSISSFDNGQCRYDWSHINMENFHEILLARAFEMRELLSFLAIAASASLLFLFGYYCFCNSSRESDLISKLNQLERSLLATHKENLILKDDLLKTRSKLTSIEDNSFGSNDMVIALKKELILLTAEKSQLQQYVSSLEKELEAAAEAGLELNKIVAELLSNQSGQESMIMNSVEDIQKQFNEQQKTILEINTVLAEKSRENSELQLMLAEQSVRFNGEIASLQQDNDELEAEKANLQTRIEELKSEFEEDIRKALEGKNVEIKRLQNEIVDVKKRFEDIHGKWQTSLAKIEALEDCMKTMKKNPNINIKEYIDAASAKAELLDLQKQRAALKSQLATETEARQHAENSLKNTISEVDKLKQEFHQSEKDKLEAQTRLEVLSNYFKEKETQLQKELSLKEAIWLKQQGENTSTVDRLTAMQEEIQSLKSQNDALRAEIEAQSAAHKAQTGTLENRAHETWLAARQLERRFEEARAEAAALRRRLTELSGVAAVENKMTATDLNNGPPSPIMPPPLMDTASSPLLGRLPPPQFLPFMAPPPPPPSFLNLPPPPFLTPVEMRPAPLGRMMSPPLARYSPPPPPPPPGPSAARRGRNRSDYYDDDYDVSDESDYNREEYDYDYDDDDDDDDHDDDHRRRRRRRSGNGSDSWRTRSYSPPPPERSYRSQSPTDSRYNYTADRDPLSTYDTDLSPPTSPHVRAAGVSGGSGSRTENFAHSARSPGPSAKEASHAKKPNKGVTNSDSDKSYNSTHHNKKGKSMV